MTPEQKPESEAEKPADAAAPAEAASTDEQSKASALEEPATGSDEVIDATNGAPDSKGDGKPPKKPNAIKKFFHKVNLYLLIFVLLLVVGGAITIVSYLNSKKAPAATVIPSQKLTQDDLKNLANSDATVGSSAQTLTIQGNAIFNGQALIRKDVAIAGNLQVGGTFQISNLTVADKTNLHDTQTNTLQVAQSSSLQGQTTINNLDVSGPSSFHGMVTMSQLTVSKIVFAGNAIVQIPNHLAFTGATPLRRIDANVLGAGGSSSLNGSDTSGTININTGSNPTAGCFASVTFNVAFSTQPRVIISPVGSAAGALQYYVNRTTSGFSLCSNNAPAPNAVFAFDYFTAGS